MCKHERTVIETTGGWRILQDEPVDDIQEKVRCLDCFAEVEEQIMGEKNLLDPLEFDDTNIAGFMRNFRCGICFSYLVRQDAIDFSPSNHKYNLSCPAHGVIIKGGAIHISQVEGLEIKTQITARELKPKTAPRSEAEILADLGF